MFNIRTDDQSSKDLELKARGKNKNNGADIGNITNTAVKDEAPAKVFRNNDVDDGVIAFGLWLAAQEEERQTSSSNSGVPITVKEFILDRLVVLYDRIMQRDISVVFSDGVPSCKECSDSTGCAHVGFAICAEQMHRRTALE